MANDFLAVVFHDEAVGGLAGVQEDILDVVGVSVVGPVVGESG